MELSALEEEPGIELTKGRYASLAGHLLEKAGEVLQAGSSFEHKGLQFTVPRGSARSVKEAGINIL